ncbi:MAG: choice-of-anchor tandem repeat GloVer-containing protein [Bacteroidia bacterium]
MNLLRLKPFIILCLSLFHFGNLKAQKTEFWGMTSTGGAYDFGVIYKTDSLGTNFSTEQSFFRHVGGSPHGSIINAQNGLFYGLARQYGAFESGVIFEFNPETKNYNAVFEFNDKLNGKQPVGQLSEGANNQLFGIASSGGFYGSGTLYSYNYSTDSLRVLHHFNQKTDGSSPEGSPFYAADGHIYGMTMRGGANNQGIIYKYDLALDSFFIIHEFDNKTGGISRCSFIEPTKGVLVGMATIGGSNNNGLIFELNTTTLKKTILAEFDGTNTGAYPYGELLKASDGYYYGLTLLKGQNSKGTLFKYDYTNNSITSSVHFTPTEIELCNGSLIEINKVLYGTSQYGGKLQDGSIFSYNLTTEKLNIIANFDDDERTGRVPKGNLLHYNGNLYGLAATGASAQGQGSLFKYNISSNTLTKVLNFNGSPQGRAPHGDLCFDPVEQAFYGTAQYGEFTYGTIFKYDPVRKTHKTLHHFTGGPGGSYPTGYMVLAPNGKLYGATGSGGANYDGALYELDPKTNKFEIKASFNRKLTGTSVNRLLITSTGELLGLAKQGGSNAFDGVIFQYDYINDTLFQRAEFKYSESGSYPYDGIEESVDGNFYGVTSQGGTNSGRGTIFKFDPVNDTITPVKVFYNNKYGGTAPFGGIAIDSSGVIYGRTNRGADHGFGALFKYNPTNDSLTVLHSFKSSYYTNCKLMIYNNSIYATNYSGGNNNLGYVYRYNMITDSFSITKHLTQVSGSNPMYTQMVATNICYHSFSEQAIKLCDAEMRSPSGKYLWTTSGIYHDTIKNAVGCDSIITFKLTIGKSSSLDTSISSCKPIASPSGKYTWSQSGVYYDTLLNTMGCDSIIKLNLTITEPTKTAIDTFACKLYTSPSGKHIWNSDGVYFDTLQTLGGCDSIIEITLDIITYAEPNYIDTTVCDSLISASTFKVWHTSGTYYDTVEWRGTCDQIFVYNLTVNKSTDTMLNVSTDFEYKLPSGRIVTGAGFYSDTIPNNLGCDSVITINLVLGNSKISQKRHQLPKNQHFNNKKQITAPILRTAKQRV